MISVSGVTEYRNHYTEKKQQQVLHHLLIQNTQKKHLTQVWMLITVCLKVSMKATKIYKLKIIFITNEGHYSLLQKSTTGSNKINNKEPDYKYSKTSEFSQHRTTNQHLNTSQCMHESTQ